jgi:hypothetical protein
LLNGYCSGLWKQAEPTLLHAGIEQHHGENRSEAIIQNMSRIPMPNEELHIDAMPTKAFFVDMLVRDIPLERAVLD